MIRPSNDNSPMTSRDRAVSTLGATAVLATLSGAIAWQMTGKATAAIYAFVCAAVIVVAAWNPVALRGGEIRVGRAVMVGFLVVAGACVGMVAGSGAIGSLFEAETATALFAAVWIVTPIVVAAAVGIAHLTRYAVSRRR